jgi:hypothetical protein
MFAAVMNVTEDLVPLDFGIEATISVFIVLIIMFGTPINLNVIM